MAEIKDFARMCNVERKHRGCFGCPLYSIEREAEIRAREAEIKNNCRGLLHMNTDEVDRIVTEWCEEHPQKTYAQDFLEKFPGAPRRSEKFPVAYACDIYSELDRVHCKNFGNDCEKCWNEVMPDA